MPEKIRGLSPDLQSAVDAIEPERIAFFIGSGLSIPAGYPTWSDSISVALETALPRCSIDADRCALRAIAEASHPTLFFESARKMLSKPDYVEVKRLAFEAHSPNPDPPDTIDKLVRSNWRIIVTTNYDRLIETAYSRAFGAPPIVALNDQSGYRMVLHARQPLIFKIHGCLSAPDTMIASSTEYMAQYGTRGFRDALTSVLANNQVIFLGSGLDESEINELWRDMCDAMSPPRFSGVVFTHEGHSHSRTVADLRDRSFRVVVSTGDDWDFLAPVVDRLAARNPGSTTVPVSSKSRSERSADAVREDDIARFLVVRFSGEERDARRRFLRAVALNGLCGVSDESGATVRELLNRVLPDARPGAGLLHDLAETIRSLCRSKVVEELTDQRFRISAEASETIRQQQERFSADLAEVSRRATEGLSLGAEEGKILPSSAVTEVASRVLRAQAEDVAHAVIEGLAVQDDASEIKSIVNSFLSEQGVPTAAPDMFRALRRFFLPSSTVHRQTVERFVSAHLTATSLLIDPDVEKAGRLFASQHQLFLDADVLLPLLADGHDTQDLYQSILARSSRLGMRLLVSTDMLDEVRHVFDRGVRDMQDLEGQGVSIADAVGAQAELTSTSDINPFALGFARACVHGGIDWRTYLASLTPGGDLSPKNTDLTKALNAWGISTVDATRLGTPSPDHPQKIAAAIVAARGTRRGMASNHHERLSLNEGRVLAHLASCRAAADHPYPTSWLLTTDRHLPRVVEKVRHLCPESLTYDPVRWAVYLSLLEPNGDLRRSLGANCLEATSAGFTEFVARQTVLALIRKRSALKADGVLTLREMAKQSLQNVHMQNIEEELRRTATDEDAAKVIDNAVQKATAELIPTTRERIAEMEKVGRTVKTLKHKNRQLKRELQTRPKKSRKKKRR